MALSSPKYPEWDEDYLRAAIVHYYIEKHHSIRKIAKALKMSYTMVRRVLITSADCEMREYAGMTTETRYDGTKMRRCTACGDELPLDAEHFHRDKNKAGGFAYKCKDCRNVGR